MDNKLYDLMDWEAVEAIVYADESHPKRILGAKIIKQGVLIQCFFPGEKEVFVQLKDKKYQMSMEDENGFFAILLPNRKIPAYYFLVGKGDSCKKVYDPYSFESQISKTDEKKFHTGLLYDMYRVLGAHPCVLDGVEGTYFAVWAPNALRVSVVGSFNTWNGRCHPMEKKDYSGIYELFIPGVGIGALYKFEVKQKGGTIQQKRDPVAFAEEDQIDGASIVALTDYLWTDQKWMESRNNKTSYDAPVYIYKVDPTEHKEPVTMLTHVASRIARYGCNYVEFMNTGEESHFYSPLYLSDKTSFMSFINQMHEKGTGVILDVSPSHFTREASGLSKFDGSYLYEYTDTARRKDPLFDDYAFAFESHHVRNYLISSILFWVEVYHIDGIKIDMLDAILYLDYSKKEGEWKANIYGGNEDLEALEFVKHLNSIMKKRHQGVLMIAEENSNWPNITGDLEKDGLGFDYKWNKAFDSDLLDYMCLDPLYRGAHHEELLFSMIYAYSERYILGFPYCGILSGDKALYHEMPGEDTQKMANLRLLEAYIVAHPGKKMIYNDLNSAKENDSFSFFMQNLIKLYKEQPALYACDFMTEGFEWIDNLEWERNLLVFLRKTDKKEETLLVVCNFSGNLFEKLPVGVPYAGKYKEIFNSDTTAYGGNGNVNPRIKMSRKVPQSERDNSIVIKMAPLSLSIFSFTKTVDKLATNRVAKNKPK